jgi:hypothetical protein
MSDPGFTFYADNFLGGTIFMSDAQVGKYVRCLCAQKLNGHLSLEELKSIAKDDKKVLEKFKQDSEGRYFNERLQKEIDKRSHHSELQRDRINKRWHKHDTTVLPGNESGNTCMNTGIEIETDIKNEFGIKEGMQGEKEKTWRNDFETYLKECGEAFDKLAFDLEWIEQKKRYYPYTSIRKSLEKMINEYWGTEAGWMKKKSNTKLKTINWLRTIENGLSMDRNRVRIPKGTPDFEQEEIEKSKHGKPAPIQPK